MTKLTKKKFLRLDPSAIGKMKAPELRELLRGARNLYTQQESKFSKYKDKVWSPALDKMQDFYEVRGQKAASRMNMSEMRSEVFRLQEFFESDTSTVPGARKVMLDQDRRIFGTDENNRPLGRMTLEQRTDFWAAYNEFKDMMKEGYVRNMGSNTIQQYLGQMVIEAAKARNEDDFLFTAGTFEELRRRLEEQKSEKNWESSDYDYTRKVLSGKRLD